MRANRNTGSLSLLHGLAMLVFLSTASPSFGEELQKIDVGIGSLTEVSGGTLFATRTYMEKNRLFEKTARGFGYDVQVKWLTFPFAPELISAGAAGDLQIGSIASFPLIRQIALGQSVYPLQLAWAGWRNLIVVRKGGSIKSFEDLKGKTIGVALGTTLEAFIRTFIQLELGGTPEQLAIKLVSQPFPVPTLPRGVDAMLTFYPAFLLVEKKGDLEILVDSFGETGTAYEGPLGKGPGIAVPSAKKSPFWPEGYAVSRGYWVVFGNLAKTHPKLVEAWIIANETAFKSLSQLPLEEYTRYFPDTLWSKLSRKDFEEKFVQPELLRLRGWTWPTKGEVELMSKESALLSQMGALKSTLTEADIERSFQLVNPLLADAYTRTGAFPAQNDFADIAAKDKRGVPTWQLP